MTEFVIGFLVGVAIGAAVALVVSYLRSRSSRGQMREMFSALAAEALDANSQRLGQQAGTLLEGKKELIDQAVKAINERLSKMGEELHRIEAERQKEFGTLGGQITSLTATTGDLHKMLASTQRRGAWGERMAEDILRLAGLQAGINYSKQSAEDVDSGRPDFTFFLPNDLKANMDVKFPLESYKAYLDAANDNGRAASLKQLVTAVRGHIRAVASRGYIDASIPTVPYVIVFLPSEQVYSLVLASQPDLMDESLQKRVVLASPLTLYAMLVVIRQAAENANIMKTADEVLALMNQFYKQWTLYNEHLDKLGERIEAAVKQFDYVSTTRSNALQKPLEKIEQLRLSRATGPDEAANTPVFEEQ